MLETSGSFAAANWVESFIRQTLGFHSSSVMQSSTEREMLSSGGEIKWDSFWKEWDSSKSLHNCILVRVLIISSTKWEMLKTGESATNFILCFISRSWIYWPSLLSAFHSELEFSFPSFPCSENGYGGLQSTLKHYRTESRTTHSSDNRLQTGHFVSAVQLW